MVLHLVLTYPHCTGNRPLNKCSTSSNGGGSEVVVIVAVTV